MITSLGPPWPEETPWSHPSCLLYLPLHTFMCMAFCDACRPCRDGGGEGNSYGLNWVPPNSYVKVLTPRTSERDPIWEWNHC